MSIHADNPFSLPVDQRDPVRRLRGRLAAPVTVLTAESNDIRAGLTVSSFFVVEGDEALTAALVGTGTDFVDAAEASGTFVAHILTEDCHSLADIFAGIRPAPGGMFRGLDVETTDWGPRLSAVSNWAGCRLVERRPLGDQSLLVGAIEDLAVSDLSDPLVYFRGTYRQLGGS